MIVKDRQNFHEMTRSISDVLVVLDLQSGIDTHLTVCCDKTKINTAQPAYSVIRLLKSGFCVSGGLV